MNFSSIEAIYSEQFFLNLEFGRKYNFKRKKDTEFNITKNNNFSTSQLHSESENSPNLPKSSNNPTQLINCMTKEAPLKFTILLT